MRRILVIAETEFLALVRTKAFIIGVLLVPALMVVFISFMNYAEDHVDTTDRTIAVIDDTGVLFAALASRAATHNEEAGSGDAKKAPHFLLREIAAAGRDRDDVTVELSEQVRGESLFAFVEIPARILEGGDDGAVRFYALSRSARPVTAWLQAAITEAVAERRFAAAGIDRARVKELIEPATITRFGLVERGPDNRAVPAREVDDLERIGLPMFVLVLMFMSVMTGAMHLLNAIIEEKMSKISEVLLGSVTPVELLSGKLAGVVGVSLLLTVVYLLGGIYMVIAMGRPDLIDIGVIGWFMVFMVSAALMFGAIFLAVGSACSDLKDSQSMVQPAMMLIVLAYLASFVVMQAPDSSLSVGLSMFPTIAPFAMVLRLAMPPGPPLWQVLLSVVLLMAATWAVVWSAGRIFRVGLLMQGKPPNIPELLKWIRK
jgi:ABC-2 type transport system permease protein